MRIFSGSAETYNYVLEALRLIQDDRSQFFHGFGHVHSHVGHPVLGQGQQDWDELSSDCVNGDRLCQGLDAEERRESVKVVGVSVECDKTGNGMTTGPLSAKNL